MLYRGQDPAAQPGEMTRGGRGLGARLQRTDAELATRARRLEGEIEEAARRAAALREGCEQLGVELADVREERDAGRGRSRRPDGGSARLSAMTEVEIGARELRGRTRSAGHWRSASSSCATARSA